MTTEIVMLIIGILVAEGTEVAPWLAKRLVRRSAKLRYADQRRAEVRAEELEALIDTRPGKLFKLATALCFVIQASGAKVRRRMSAGRWRRSPVSKVYVSVEDLYRLSPEFMRRREGLYKLRDLANSTVMDHQASAEAREAARLKRLVIERELHLMEKRGKPFTG